MAHFFYRATNQTGEVVEGDVEAVDETGAIQKIRQMDCFPVEITTKRPQAFFEKSFLFVSSLFPAISSKELLKFTQQLATLLGSKLTLDRSLGIVANLAEHPPARELFLDIKNRVHEGSSFADALAAHPRVFSKMYVSIVKAGEAGGVLDTVLTRLALLLEKSHDLKMKVTTALIYPSILVVSGCGAILFLMIHVIPKFTEIFKDMGDALPLITVSLMTVTSYITEHGWTLSGIAVIFFVGFILFLKTPSGQFWWHGILLKLPVLGNLIRKIEASRFSRTLSTLLKSGVPILPSLMIVRDVLNNCVVATSMYRLHDALKGGQSISQPLNQLETFPPLAAEMIVVGEETGELEEMLEKVADIFDKEVDVATQRAVGLIGPVLILVLGGMVAFMVIGVLWGMLSMSDIII